MLRITADMYSGRENPSWIAEDEIEVMRIMQDIGMNRSMMTEEPPGNMGLGLRGFELEVMDDETAQNVDLPSSFYVSVKESMTDSSRMEVVDRLIALVGKAEPFAAQAEDSLAQDVDLGQFLRSELTRTSRTTVLDTQDDGGAAGADQAEPLDATCMIELGSYNPTFWNNNATVRGSNNCYNYASNWRTNTFAQPGRGSGSMYKSITCAEVSRAALHDGMHRRYHCFPDSEKPRYLVALVVAPGPDFVDYHWYRKQKQGFWGHKPGGTAARNTDNSGRVISDPRTCDRGPYTHFCGFFYGCNSQRRRIR